ncbi:DUF1456 family protein [Desulfobacter sp.]|uniref:DUF1456 family protein n=1 Tax=Desulfobacter sp. TaxID=2294 RepID=UPI00338D4E2E
MTNNDILRRLRYAFDMSEGEMAAIYAHTGTRIPREPVTCWLLQDQDPAFVPCRDKDMARFLNGLIIDRRGTREDGPAPETRLTNNAILLKLKIALNLRTDEVLELLALGGMSLGKSELTAFFRRPDHRHFRRCNDQVRKRCMNHTFLSLSGCCIVFQQVFIHVLWHQSFKFVFRHGFR